MKPCKPSLNKSVSLPASNKYKTKMCDWRQCANGKEEEILLFMVCEGNRRY